MKSRGVRVLLVDPGRRGPGRGGHRPRGTSSSASRPRGPPPTPSSATRGRRSSALGELRAAQQAYVAEGQAPDTWLAKAAGARRRRSGRGLAALRAAAGTVEAQGALESAIEAFTALRPERREGPRLPEVGPAGLGLGRDLRRRRARARQGRQRHRQRAGARRASRTRSPWRAARAWQLIALGGAACCRACSCCCCSSRFRAPTRRRRGRAEAGATAEGRRTRPVARDGRRRAPGGARDDPGARGCGGTAAPRRRPARPARRSMQLGSHDRAAAGRSPAAGEVARSDGGRRRLLVARARAGHARTAGALRARSPRRSTPPASSSGCPTARTARSGPR